MKILIVIGIMLANILLAPVQCTSYMYPRAAYDNDRNNFEYYNDETQFYSGYDPKRPREIVETVKKMFDKMIEKNINYHLKDY